MHVAVVVRVLAHAAQRVELREHDRREAELVHPREAVERRVGDDDPLELREDPLGRDASEARRVGPRRRRGRRVDREAELAREPRDPQGAQRVGGERLGRHHAQPPRGEVLAPAVRVHDLPARERLGHRVDGQVARGEVGRERRALERRDVDLPRLAGADHAPAAERVGQLERRPARRARDAPRGPARVVRDDEVDVLLGVGAAEQAVAHRAADDPRALVAQRLADRLDHASGTPSRWYTRRTRRLRPHVIS